MAKKHTKIEEDKYKIRTNNGELVKEKNLGYNPILAYPLDTLRKEKLGG